MGETSKRVAIIGCGITGLSAIKCCLDEGLQPTCFEWSDGIGGIWVYRETADGRKTASVYKSTVTNTSKESLCYSDFPFPKEWPNFMHNSYMKKYCYMYAERFGLMKYIRLTTRVTRLAQAPDYDTNGRWIVTAIHDNDEKETNYEFDAVMICTGMFTNPFRPDFPGLEEFQGKVLHSHDYRTPEGFEDKRVLVIGFGNSAVDAATEVGRIASKVFLSTRDGAWFMSRRGDCAYPYELLLYRRFHMLPFQFVVKSLKKELKHRYDMIASPIRPAHDIVCCEPVVSEDLPGCIMNGSVIIRGNVTKFTTTGVMFEDGTSEDDIDYVIMGTGYSFTFPFEVDCPALGTKNGEVPPLYKLLFPLGLKHSTLSVNGALKPLNSVIQCTELQARWASRVFKGLAKLPSQTEMEAEVKMTDDDMQKTFIPDHRYVDNIPYCDSIASEIGVRPNFLKLFFTHPVLTLRCLFGPFVPYQYRLVGPGKWDGAGEAIATVWDRVLEPTKTRRGNTVPEDSGHYIVLLIVGTAILVALVGLLISF